MKTYSPKQSEICKKWVHFDAKDKVLGRLAVEIAKYLRGKHKTTFAPHMDDGDYVVVTNAKHIHLTGNKTTKKKFFWHTGYPGGIKEEVVEKTLQGRFPSRVLMRAVKGMLPRGPLGRKQLSHLKVFDGNDHTHHAQKPTTIDFSSQNVKNSIRREG